MEKKQTGNWFIVVLIGAGAIAGYLIWQKKQIADMRKQLKSAFPGSLGWAALVDKMTDSEVETVYHYFKKYVLLNQVPVQGDPLLADLLAIEKKYGGRLFD